MVRDKKNKTVIHGDSIETEKVERGAIPAQAVTTN